MFNTDAERVSFNTCEKNLYEMLNGRTPISIGGTSSMQEKRLSTDSTFSDLISRSFSIMYANYAAMSKSRSNLGNIKFNTKTSVASNDSTENSTATLTSTSATIASLVDLAEERRGEK